MGTPLLLNILAFLLSPPNSEATSAILNQSSQLIVWNVGQGLWVTHQKDKMCHHFDMGGELMPGAALRKLCGKSNNRILFSHWDWDHIGFANRSARILANTCVLKSPGGAGTKQRIAMIERIPKCKPGADAPVHELTQALPHLMNKRQPSSNSASRVFLLHAHVLLPGDSTTKMEKLWAKDSRLKNTRILILGHHGSRTSTSPLLLDSLPRTRQAIASARLSKYGHPHPMVRLRLKARGIALITTEEWGSIYIDME